MNNHHNPVGPENDLIVCQACGTEGLCECQGISPVSNTAYFVAGFTVPSKYLEQDMSDFFAEQTDYDDWHEDFYND